jgi:hypothetical protein
MAHFVLMKLFFGTYYYIYTYFFLIDKNFVQMYLHVHVCVHFYFYV